MSLAITAPEAPPEKFADPDWTAKGEPRATVPLARLETLWINTGTLCNITCRNCYIESSPTNDRLAYISAAEVAPFLEEAAALGTREIGFTGGEPFMNPEFLAMLADALERGFEALVLTNAMQPMQRPQIERALLDLNKRYGEKLTLRVSLDHYTQSAARDRARRPARGRRRSRGSTGSLQTSSASRSPGAPAGARARPTRAPAMPVSSRSAAGRSTRTIPRSSRSFPRWTAPTMSPRSPRPAGASCTRARAT